MRKPLLVIAALVILAAIGGTAWYVISSKDDATASSSSNPGYEITAQDHTLGNKNAKVVLIEYAAPVCPHCAHFNEAYFPALKKNYIDTGKVFYVFRIFPIRPGDGPAEKLADCLPANQFFSFMDLLFQNQPKWDVDEYPSADIQGGLLQMARIAGMSEDQAKQCMASTAEDDQINKATAAAQARYNIDSTPTFVINGSPHSELAFDDLSKLLDQALAGQH